MSWLDKAKLAAGQAASKAKHGADQLQTRRELSQAYGELGRTTFELVDTGELEHARLSTTVERIRALTARLEAQPPAGPPPASGESPGDAQLTR